MQLVSLGGFNLRFVWTPKSEFFQHHNVKFVVQYLQHIKCSVYVLFVITFSLRCDFFYFWKDRFRLPGSWLEFTDVLSAPPADEGGARIFELGPNCLSGGVFTFLLLLVKHFSLSSGLL